MQSFQGEWMKCTRCPLASSSKPNARTTLRVGLNPTVIRFSIAALKVSFRIVINISWGVKLTVL